MHDVGHGGLLFTPRRAFVLLAAYYLLHVALRTLVSDSLSLDEAEQLIVTQEWRWGYGSQPPLYNWVQKIFFLAFGPSVFALALLKNLLLCGIAGGSFLAAREVFSDESAATDATLALVLVPGFVWESQRDQTHLVLATFFALATVCLALRMIRLRKGRWYLACGVMAGLGVLSKYNFALLPVALVAAVATVPDARRALSLRGALLFAGGFGAITAAHFWWMLQHWDLVLKQSHSLGREAVATAGAAWLGLGRVLLGAVEYGAVPGLIFAAYFFTRERPEAAPVARPNALQVLRRTVLIGLALAIVIAMAFHVTRVKARWLQPLLIMLPILLVAAAGPRLTTAGRRRLAGLACAVLLIVPMILYGRVLAAGLIGKGTNLNLPYSTWAEQLRAAGFNRGNILANDKSVAGNLKLQFPDSRVFTQEFNDVALLPDSPLLIAWRPAESAADRFRALRVAENFGVGEPSAMFLQSVEAPAHYGPPAPLTLGFVLMPKFAPEDLVLPGRR